MLDSLHDIKKRIESVEDAVNEIEKLYQAVDHRDHASGVLTANCLILCTDIAADKLSGEEAAGAFMDHLAIWMDSYLPADETAKIEKSMQGVIEH